MSKRKMIKAAKIRSFAVLIAVLGLSGIAAQADVIEFTDKDEWFTAVGEVTTIEFTGFPNGTLITDQYEDLGVLFTGGADFIWQNEGAFPNDGWGINGQSDIELSFQFPQAWIAVEFPGFMRLDLFAEGQLIYSSNLFGGGGAGFFAGLISDQLFDVALLTDPMDETVDIDDLHFGVPAPGTLALLGLATVLPRRGRRRRRGRN